MNSVQLKYAVIGIIVYVLLTVGQVKIFGYHWILAALLSVFVPYILMMVWIMSRPDSKKKDEDDTSGS